jgi:monoamine oxidase
MGHAFKSMIRDARKITNPYQPWRARHAQHLDDRPLSDWIASLPCSPLAKAAIEAQFANDNGAPTSRQSYLANLALVAGARSPDAEDGYFKLTENVRCEDGNQALAARLADSIRQQGGEISTRCPVDRVSLLDGKAIVNPKRGRPMSAEYVVLAVPPTAWHRITIDPPIEQDCIMSMGTVVKYLSKSDDRFWIDQEFGPEQRLGPRRRDLGGDRQPDARPQPEDSLQSICRRQSGETGVTNL